MRHEDRGESLARRVLGSAVFTRSEPAMSKTLAMVAVLAGLTGTALADPDAPASAPDQSTAAPCGASSDTTSSTTASTSTTADTTPCSTSSTVAEPAVPPPPTQTTS